MYLGMTLSKDWIPAICDHWLLDKVLGGAGQGSGVGHFETKCWNDVCCNLS